MIVITGAGLLSAIGTNQAETLQSLRDARAGLHPVRFLPTVHRELPVGEVPLSDDELRRLAQAPEARSRTALMGMIALREALTLSLIHI